MKQKNPVHHQAVESYIIQRRSLGILGLALPFLLFFGSQAGGWTPLKDSLSRYYFTNTRDVFVGVLISYAVFLISYKGYTKKDDVICNVAGTLALGIAVFPAIKPDDTLTRYYFLFLGNRISCGMHYFCALLFFSLLGYISYFLFTLSEGKLTVWKKKRNRFYRFCGLVIFGSIFFIALIIFIKLLLKMTHSPFLPSYEKGIAAGRPVFLLESFALFAFGSSWLVKGKTLWQDRGTGKPYRPQYKTAFCECRKLLGNRISLER